MKKHFIVFLTVCTFYNLAVAQEIVKLNPTKKLSQYPIKAWDMDKGLPSDMVVDLLQDTIGYIWFATYKGITRFDGISFTTYNQSSSNDIQSVTTQALAIDSNGIIWFASQKGLVKYSDYRFNRDTNLASLNSVSIEALFFDNSTNTLWIGSTSNGLFKYKDGSLASLPDFLTKSRSVIKAIGKAGGKIVVGTEGGDVIAYDGSEFTLLSNDKPLGGINSFYQTTNGNFWVSAENGVFFLKDDKVIHFEKIPVYNVNTLLEDNHNTLWIGTNNGLFRYHLQTGRLDEFNEQMGIPNNIIRGLLADSEGNMWVATYRRGIFKLTDGLITNFSETEGLSSNIITAVAQLDVDQFYVADEFGNINILKGSKISKMNLKTPISADRLKSLYVDSKHNLWISTYGGLIKRSANGVETLYKNFNGNAVETIRLVYEDNQENIWVGTRSNGLFKILPNGSMEEFSLKNGLSSNYIMSISQDMLGRIVVGTKNGINIINNNLIEKIIDMETGLPSNFTFNIHIDSDNVFWAASNDGIIRIANDRDVFVYNINNGLFDNTLFDIIEDELGYFWLPTDVGIVRISKNELTNFALGRTGQYTFRVYGRNDGMKNPRCIGATKSLRATDGRMFFNTSGGVAIVNPTEILEERLDTKVLFGGLQVNDNYLTPSNHYTISRGNNRYLFSYTLLNFKVSEKIRFRYRLVPFDSDWIDAGTSRYALYTNVPAGRYTFQVQASLNGIDWNKPVEVGLRVKRGWWNTVWFRVVLAFVLSLMLWSIYKVRTYNVKKQKEELERLVKVRTAFIAQQKVELENQSMELEKLSIVASHTNNAILITSPTAEIIWVNQSFTRIYGYTLEEYIDEKGTNLKDLSGDQNAQFIIDKCIRDQEPLNYTTEIITKNGATVWIQTSLTPVSNPDGSLRVIVVIDSDITDLKMVENEMIIMNDEIVKQADAILKQKEAIQIHRDELEQVNDLLIRHTQNIEASIWYAHTIQKAILPTKELIDSFFDNFIVFKPRDIVSGDFYWFYHLPNENSVRCIIAVVDCTGHGVPGALMSMIGSRLLSEIIADRKVYDPAEILLQLNKLVNIVLKQNSEENIDGMDVSLCLIEKTESNTVNLVFAGANRPLYILRDGAKSIEVHRGNRKTIGGIIPDLDAEFENHQLTLNQRDMIFLSTDGYIDQNGNDGKKISSIRLQQMIVEKSSMNMQEIGEFLDISFDEFRGKEQQRDDVTVIGLRF